MLYRHLPLRALVASALMLNLAVGPAALHAQQPASDFPSVTIRANTRLVVVDVIVTDKAGQPVTGLKADDFVLEEKGKKQRIAFFTPPGAPPSAAQPLPPGVLSNRPEFLRPAGIPTVLLLDAANSRFKDQAYGRWQMLKYISEQSDSGIPMAVMTLTDRLHVLQDFTSDPKILATAIKNLSPQEQALQPATLSSRGTSEATADIGSMNRGTGGGGGAAATAISMAQVSLQGFEGAVAGYNLDLRTTITIQAMKDLVRLLAGLPGRKNVVWLTSALPFDLIPNDRNMSEEERKGDLPSLRQKSLATNSAGNYASEQRSLHGEAIKQAESELASADIAIYPVDMRGIMITGIDVANSGTMEEVAAETGGKAYTNQNEIKLGIALAASDTKAAYSLGYYPEDKKWDGQYRNIKVKVEKGDTQIRYRKGYFAIEPGEPKDRNYDQDVANALQINAPSTQVAFMAQAKPTDPGKMRVVFLIDAHTLSAEDSSTGTKMNVSLFAAVYNSGGKMLGNRGIKVDRAFDAASYKQILDKGIMAPIDMDLPSGATELRLAVVDNKTGFIGTVSGPLGQ
jgi:VWFA-related protein